MTTRGVAYVELSVAGTDENNVMGEIGIINAGFHHRLPGLPPPHIRMHARTLTHTRARISALSEFFRSLDYCSWNQHHTLPSYIHMCRHSFGQIHDRAPH